MLNLISKKTRPKKKLIRPTWKNPKSWNLLMKDGVVLSGYNGIGLGGYRYRTVETDDATDNFIFTARIRPTGVSKGQSSALTLFEDDDGVHKYEASTSAMYHILRAVASGDVIATKNDYLYGAWTFRKMGRTVSIWPCNVVGEEYTNKR